MDSFDAEIGCCATFLRMRIAPTFAGVALAAALAVALAGCVQSTPPVIPMSQASNKPVFATDADALAAAKRAYVAYLAVSDEVSADGGKNPGRFAQVVTASWLPKEESSAANLVKGGRRQVGESSAQDIRMQQVSEARQIASVSIYVCLDLSAVKYVDTATGKHPTAAPKALVPIVADLVSQTAKSQTLLIERNTPWQGSNFCSQE